MPEEAEVLEHGRGDGRRAAREPAQVAEPEPLAQRDPLLDGQRARVVDPAPDERRAQLLQHAGDAAPERGPRVGEHGEHLPRVGHAGDRAAEAERAVVVALPAVDDVRRGQVGDDPAGRLDLEALLRGAGRGEHVGVGELHALRRSARSRRVDERGHVVGVRRPGGRAQVEARAAALLELLERHRVVLAAVDEHDVAEGRLGACGGGHQRQQRALGDRDDRPRVLEDLVRLLERARVVDGERDRPGVQRRRVHEMELGAVEEHQRDRVAALDAQRLQAGRDPLDALGVLRPGEDPEVARRAQRHVTRPLGRGPDERLAQRGRPQREGQRARHEGHGGLQDRRMKPRCASVASASSNAPKSRARRRSSGRPSGPFARTQRRSTGAPARSSASASRSSRIGSSGLCSRSPVMTASGSASRTVRSSSSERPSRSWRWAAAGGLRTAGSLPAVTAA